VGSNPAEDEGRSRAIQIRSTTSFGREVKPAVPCRKTQRRVKDPYSMKVILVGKFTDISRQVSPPFLLDVSDGYCQRSLVDESGMMHNRRVMVAVYGTSCVISPRKQ
jgi:hypothetical protein